MKNVKNQKIESDIENSAIEIDSRVPDSIENDKIHDGKTQEESFEKKNSTESENYVEKLEQIAVFGMVKNDKHQTRALIDENRKEMKISQELMNLITLFQDTVHDTAIGYHQKLRNKEITHSELDDIEGIGPAKKKLLLTTFGSVEKIKQASIEELIKVKGITKELAERLQKGQVQM